MENIPPELLLNKWKKGKTLNEAIWEFCDQKYINAHPGDYLPQENKISSSLIEGINSYTKAKTEINSHFLKAESAENNLKKNLSEKITCGKLIPVGYKLPIQSDFPTLIPPYMWPPENMNLSDSSISAHEIDFVRVRIVKKSEFQNKEIILPKIKPEDKKIGRPSLKKKIITAYALLKKDGKIDYSKTLKSHTDLIQKTIRILFPEIKNTAGMEHEAIRRAIGDIFKRDKETSKLTSKL